MKFVSTRNKKKQVGFAQAILDCLPQDGGMFVPAYEENLRPWIYYMDETTSFSSIAGSLTSALLKEEFSPIISEAIAAKAFTFSPELRQLDERLFMLELFHGPTGSYKDFGISYLASCLEHILLLQDKKALIVSVSKGGTGSSIAHALRGKKRTAAVILYAKDTMRGLNPADFIWNGGNIFPVEIDGTLDQCYSIAAQLFADRKLVSDYSLTLANTVNIGRLIPQSFFYMYAFTRLKAKVSGDIFYSLSAGNYGNLAAGLYSWKFSLPVNGFITDSTSALLTNAQDRCELLDSSVPLNKREPVHPLNPSNIERLEEVFFANPAVMRALIYPAPVTQEDQISSFKHIFKKYHTLIDPDTAAAHAAMQKKRQLIEEDDGAVVLIARNHPSFSNSTLRHWCGETVPVPSHIAQSHEPVNPEHTVSADKESVVRIIQEISQRR